MGAVEVELGAERPASHLRLRAREPGVAVARQFVAGMGDVLHLDEDACEDLKLAVTEACTNVVLHAYPNGHDGPVELELDSAGDDVLLTVRDEGCGPPSPEQVEGEEAGYGLALIQAVSDALDLGSGPGGGTELRITFRAARQTRRDPLDAVHSPVLRRVMAMVAAQAGFGMDRLSDAVLMAETLAENAHSHAPDGIVRVVLEDRRRDVLVRVGPLLPGGASGLLADSRLPAYGGVLEHLADDVAVEQVAASGGELLVVRIAAR